MCIYTNTSFSITHLVIRFKVINTFLKCYLPKIFAEEFYTSCYFVHYGHIHSKPTVSIHKLVKIYWRNTGNVIS